MGDSQEWEARLSLWRQTLRSLLDTVPAGYLPGREAASDIREAVTSELGVFLQPRLNLHLKQMPQESYLEKAELASWTNAELRQLGLTIRCEKTNAPGILLAFRRSSVDESSQFRMESTSADGRRKCTTPGALPSLKLMAEPTRLEPLSRHNRQERKNAPGGPK